MEIGLHSEFLNETSFQLEIERLVREDGLNYLEAILSFCDKHDLEPEEVKKLMTSNLKGKLKLAAMENGYFKQENTLPL